MAEQEAVQRFLMGMIGYGKIKALVEGEKPLGVSVLGFLNGTAFGMCGDAKRRYDVNGWNMPLIPRIETDGASSEGLEWKIETEVMFKGKKPARIADLVRRFHKEAFPEASLSEENVNNGDKGESNTFSVTLHGKGIYVKASGRHIGIEKRLLIAIFKLPPDEVSGINSAVAEYLRAVKAPFPEPLKVFSRKAIASLSAAPIENASLLGLLENGKGGLILSALMEANPPLYRTDAPYERGSLIAHLSFGFGLVTHVEGSVATVYFPRHSETKTLLCRK